MSRKVIHDLIIPIVTKIMREEKIFDSLHHYDIQDETLEEFLFEKLKQMYSSSGSFNGNCDDLRAKIQETLDQGKGHELKIAVKMLLEEYIQFRMNLGLEQLTKDQALRKILGKAKKTVPDRMDKVREKAREVWR